MENQGWGVGKRRLDALLVRPYHDAKTEITTIIGPDRWRETQGDIRPDRLASFVTDSGIKRFVGRIQNDQPPRADGLMQRFLWALVVGN